MTNARTRKDIEKEGFVLDKASSEAYTTVVQHTAEHACNNIFNDIKDLKPLNYRYKYMKYMKLAIDEVKGSSSAQSLRYASEDVDDIIRDLIN